MNRVWPLDLGLGGKGVYHDFRVEFIECICVRTPSSPLLCVNKFWPLELDLGGKRVYHDFKVEFFLKRNL